MSKRNTSDLPHSWAIEHWPETVFPSTAQKARYVIRAHRDELLVCGALSRVGRNLIVLGAGYGRWLQTKAANVPGYEVAANRAESHA